MSVFGVRKEFSDVKTPKTSISASAGSVGQGFPYLSGYKTGFPIL